MLELFFGYYARACTTTQNPQRSIPGHGSTNQTIPHPPPATPKAKSKPNATSLVARYNVKAKASSLRRSRQRKYKIELAQLAVTWGRAEGYARGSLVLSDDPNPGLVRGRYRSSGGIDRLSAACLSGNYPPCPTV